MVPDISSHGRLAMFRAITALASLILLAADTTFAYDESSPGRLAPGPWADRQEPPASRAQALLAGMSLQEKVHMLHGSGAGYVGNVEGIMRLGIPALKLNDGPQGFRAEQYPGTSTQFPCALSMAATWDLELAWKWGSAMGQEFFDKGANIQLGPGVCVARVPQNGRNFEYLSGEDPYLGWAMVQPVVAGIQSQTVVANAKHFVHNNQEKDRTRVDVVVDERTQAELYLPPFEGAIRAGVGSFMCSYNKINGISACENNGTLNGILKEQLGFQGWVMSDWGGTHSNSINQGLDQQMPDDEWMSDDILIKAVREGQVSEAKVDDSVLRILTPLFAVGVMDNQTLGTIDANVTSVENNKLARDLAAAGMVLLANDGILPLTVGPADQPFSVALIGYEAVAPTVGGGGSGKVAPYYISFPMSAIREVMGLPPLPPYRNIPAKECDASGLKCIYFAATSEKAVIIAPLADLAIVFGATTSSEGSDRQSLSLDNDVDVLIAATARAQPNTVAVVVTPGAVLMPWSDQVRATVLSFMPGQEYGHGLTDVLFGAINPSARLPLSLPNEENEVGFTPEQYPGVYGTTTYSEEMLVGYRWYDAKGMKPKYPFGHGLSFTTFDYADIEATRASVSFTLTNTGKSRGAEVSQLYLTFPASAGEPPLQLKAFKKVFLEVGEAARVVLLLDDRSISVYDVASHAWRVVMVKNDTPLPCFTQTLRARL